MKYNYIVSSVMMFFIQKMSGIALINLSIMIRSIFFWYERNKSMMKSRVNVWKESFIEIEYKKSRDDSLNDLDI